jgi:hypothetical protein
VPQRKAPPRPTGKAVPKPAPREKGALIDFSPVEAETSVELGVDPRKCGFFIAFINCTNQVLLPIAKLLDFKSAHHNFFVGKQDL